MAASSSAYHFGLPGAADQAVVAASIGSSRPSARGIAPRHGIDRRVDDDLDVVLPADGEMVLEHGDRIEIGRRFERVVEDLDGADPVDPVRPPASCACDRHSKYHRPWRTTTAHGSTSVTHSDPASERYPSAPGGDPSRPGRESVVVPGSGRAAARSGAGRRGPADRLGLGGHRLRQRPHDLAKRAADRIGRVARVVMAVEHRHHQSECLGGAEHQGWQPQAAADTVAAVGPTHRVDRNSGLAKDADVAAGGALGDAELVGQSVGGDAWAALDQFQGEQRPGGGAGVCRHGFAVPDG